MRDHALHLNPIYRIWQFSLLGANVLIWMFLLWRAPPIKKLAEDTFTYLSSLILYHSSVPTQLSHSYCLSRCQQLLELRRRPPQPQEVQSALLHTTISIPPSSSPVKDKVREMRLSDVVLRMTCPRRDLESLLLTQRDVLNTPNRALCSPSSHQRPLSANHHTPLMRLPS